MMELVFVESKTGKVVYAITGVDRVRYITPSEVGFDKDGRPRGASFPQTEHVEVRHISEASFRVGVPSST